MSRWIETSHCSDQRALPASLFSGAFVDNNSRHCLEFQNCYGFRMLDYSPRYYCTVPGPCNLLVQK